MADPRAAVARARELAGAGGAVLATGSIYLIADLVRERGAAGRRPLSRRTLAQTGGAWQDHANGRRRRTRLRAMIGLVAIVVATVILVFFGFGYLLGRIFL